MAIVKFVMSDWLGNDGKNKVIKQIQTKVFSKAFGSSYRDLVWIWCDLRSLATSGNQPL